MAVPDGPNQRWSLDFVSDALSWGRRFRILCIVDDFTREALALVVDTSISGHRMAREGILRLVGRYGRERVEAACDRGLEIGARSYGAIQSILQNNLDQTPRRPSLQGELLLPEHSNIRGSRHYH